MSISQIPAKRTGPRHARQVCCSFMHASYHSSVPSTCICIKLPPPPLLGHVSSFITITCGVAKGITTGLVHYSAMFSAQPTLNSIHFTVLRHRERSGGPDQIKGRPYIAASAVAEDEVNIQRPARRPNVGSSTCFFWAVLGSLLGCFRARFGRNSHS